MGLEAQLEFDWADLVVVAVVSHYGVGQFNGGVWKSCFFSREPLLILDERISSDGIIQGKAQKPSNIQYITPVFATQPCVIFLKKDAIHELIEVASRWSPSLNCPHTITINLYFARSKKGADLAVQ